MREMIWLTAALAFAGPAEAALISTPVQSFELNYDSNSGGPNQISHTIHLSPFDASLGTLDRVIVNFDYGQLSQLEVNGVNQSPMSYARYLGQFTSLFGYHFQEPGLFFDAYYEGNTYAEASCEPAYPFDCTAYGEGGFAILDAHEVGPNNLPVFAGPNDIPVDVINGGILQLFIESVAGGLGSARATSQLTGQIWLDYYFTPLDSAQVNEPPASILCALALLGLITRKTISPGPANAGK